MLERGDRRGDWLACALLTVGVTFSSLGLPFIVAACVDVALRGERLRRLYIVAVPALLYAAWWVGWGHTADTALSLHNAANTPHFILDAADAVFASLFGLAQGVSGGPDWGQPLLLVALALGAWRLHRMVGCRGSCGSRSPSSPRSGCWPVSTSNTGANRPPAATSCRG